MEHDFSGYATRFGTKCADGLEITSNAFKLMHNRTVPLVWQHGHGTPKNVLGHAKLEVRSDGVYTYCFFNGTEQAKTAKELVVHRDITDLSIFANDLSRFGNKIQDGQIREVSLAISGANPGAKIDFVSLQHSDGTYEELDNEAVIHPGESFVVNDASVKHANGNPESGGNPNAGDPTVSDVYNSLTDEQKTLVAYMVETALSSVAQSAINSTTDDGVIKNMHNVFEGKNGTSNSPERPSLSHAEVEGIFTDAMKCGSLKTAVTNYAIAHGIEDIDLLFPDAQSITATPEWKKRRTEWVAGVLGATRHTPFSRVKSLVADITLDDARARGYVTGAFKKEEYFSLTKRTTGPTTIYKKQKLDRDDILDIRDFDSVAWIRGELRLMLEEEIARAILIGDGRTVDDPDKVKDPAGTADGSGLRSVLNDHELYTTTVYCNIADAGSSYLEVVDTIIRSRRFYRGTGMPVFYTTEPVVAELLILRDTNGRRYWRTLDELATELRVSAVVTVEPMEDVSGVIGIIVNLSDYNIGADRGGEISTFDDFDIDYNQYKYLTETRISGALVKIKSAIVVKAVESTLVLATPTKPAFNRSTNVVTIPTVTGVIYKNAATGATLSAGAQSALSEGAKLSVTVSPDTGYYFDSTEYDWTFTYVA